jgi:type IV pilus assembly protein PilN
MRLDINLASRPYEDARQFWLRWGTATAVAAILSAALLFFTVTSWLDARRDHTRISEFKAQIAERDRERAKAEAFLNLPANRTTRDRSQFINGLIERKAFSWTKVFEELERVMPARLHVVSIHPEMTADNQLELQMLVAGESSERALDLVKRMESSAHFQDTHVNETRQAAGGGKAPGDNVEFNISALYVPEKVERSAQ